MTEQEYRARLQENQDEYWRRHRQAVERGTTWAEALRWRNQADYALALAFACHG